MSLDRTSNVFGEMTALQTRNGELEEMNKILLLKISKLETERAHWESHAEFQIRKEASNCAKDMMSEVLMEELQKTKEENKNLKRAHEEDVETLTAEKQKLEKELRTYKADCKELEDELDTLRTRPLQHEDEMRRLRKEKECAIANLQKKLDFCQDARQTLEWQTYFLSNESEDLRTEVAAGKKEIERLTEENAERTRQLTMAQQILGVLQAEKEEGPITSLQFYRMEADLEDAHEENAELRDIVDRLRKEKETLRNDLVAEHNKAVDEHKKVETKLVAECCEMSNKMAELKVLTEAMRGAITVLSGMVAE